ncbi:hypothetical protein, partial [Klebsiella pneumoniae]|uniref:hypothetical protein n=1 Tax=Klebsiella pneumoniae TaxID=573 RepID=UPI003CEB3AFD
LSRTDTFSSEPVPKIASSSGVHEGVTTVGFLGLLQVGFDLFRPQPSIPNALRLSWTNLVLIHRIAG